MRDRYSKWSRAPVYLAYVVAISILILGIASIYASFHRGADRTQIFKEAATMIRAQSARIDFHSKETVVLSAFEQQRMLDQYAAAVRAVQLSRESGDFELIHDFLEGHALKTFESSHALDRSEDAPVASEITMVHFPTIEFESLDGQLLILKDSAIEHRQVSSEERLIFKEHTASIYRSMVALLDGRWKITQRQLLSRTKCETPSRTDVATDLISWKGINYYPRSSPWSMFGSQFDPDTLHADFERMQDLGVNAIRIFIPYEAFGGRNIQESLLEQVEDLLDIAQEYHIQTLITLFDMYGNYDISDWPACGEHLSGLIPRLKEHPALFGWDLKNEPDLDYPSRGKARITAWLTAMISEIQMLDEENPITVGWSNPQEAAHLAQDLDFVSFHFYKDANELGPDIQDLRDKVKGKAILLEEYGFSSYRGIWTFFRGGTSDQHAYFAEILEVTSREKLPFMTWTLHDFDHLPNRVLGRLPWRKAFQKHYGLFDVDGEPKESAFLIQSYNQVEEGSE